MTLASPHDRSRGFRPAWIVPGVLILALGLASCGGSATPEDTFGAARTSFQGGDYETARAGFARLTGDAAAPEDLRRKAGLYGAVCAGFLGDAPAARTAFDDLDATEGAALGADSYLWAADQLAEAGQIEVALHVVALATKRFPDQKGDFESVAKRIAEKGGEDAAKQLEGLGYLK